MVEEKKSEITEKLDLILAELAYLRKKLSDVEATSSVDLSHGLPNTTVTNR